MQRQRGGARPMHILQGNTRLTRLSGHLLRMRRVVVLAAERHALQIVAGIPRRTPNREGYSPNNTVEISVVTPVMSLWTGHFVATLRSASRCAALKGPVNVISVLRR